MSWLSIPLPNPFESHEFTDADEETASAASSRPVDNNDAATANDDLRGGVRVKDGISAISETISRQLLGVATFLAPPPFPETTAIFQQPEPNCSSGSSSSSLTLAGIRSDLEEIGGSFKSSLSMLSSNRAVSEISKLASSLFQMDDDNRSDESDHGQSDVSRVGISDEVVEFVNGISKRPDCWTDFPLSIDEDFRLSPAQSEHASIIEHLVPTFATLRANLTSDMSSEKFWMIYFILLIPRLEENDLELLSTPEIVEARDYLLMTLKEKRNEKLDNSDKPQQNSLWQAEAKGASDHEKIKGSSSEEKAALAESGILLSRTESKGENTDKLLEVEDDGKGCNADPRKQLKNEDGFCFSDLEDDSDQQPGRIQDTETSLLDSSTEWVQLSRNTDCDNVRLIEHHFTSRDGDSEGQSSDWLAVDEFD